MHLQMLTLSVEHLDFHVVFEVNYPPEAKTALLDQLAVSFFHWSDRLCSSSARITMVLLLTTPP